MLTEEQIDARVSAKITHLESELEKVISNLKKKHDKEIEKLKKEHERSIEGLRARYGYIEVPLDDDDVPLIKESTKKGWTPEENQKLIDLHNNRTRIKEIAEIIERSVVSINQQLMKLKKEDDYKKLFIPRKEKDAIKVKK